MEKYVRTALALLLIIVLSAIIVYAVLPYIDYFFGAFILSVIFKPLYYFLLKRARLNRQISAALVIIISMFLILIPLYFLLSMVISEIQQILLNQESIMASVQSGSQLFSRLFSRLGINGTLQASLEERVMDLATQAVNYLSLLVLGSIQNISQRIIGFLLMYFLLYYLLTGEDSDFMQNVFMAIPFNTKNTIILLDEFRNTVRTTLIASGAIAIIEGGILIASFIIFGIQGAFLWGSIAAVLSFLPVVGAPLIWIPVIIIQLLQQDYTAAIGILVTGVLLNIADNSFLRPVIQKKVGKIHPFQSLLGIVIGVSLFGLVGIIIGPLLLAYFYLTVKMFSEEYLSDKE
ncbi:AI-2E family transporter [Methanosarcina sp. DH2]|uniref:AI-2E family transporter n=1 Tax=Methanosarcina sp. DH2 TaxID=2605639 RepID=UPI001E485C4F|nr:AI-2E family transporter [Methanosarcina sp. DH2]MCC4769236.1 AI-2E family transporter [Methanosarcina sp. DH2]